MPFLRNLWLACAQLGPPVRRRHGKPSVCCAHDGGATARAVPVSSRWRRWKSDSGSDAIHALAAVAGCGLRGHAAGSVGCGVQREGAALVAGRAAAPLHSLCTSVAGDAAAAVAGRASGPLRAALPVVAAPFCGRCQGAASAGAWCNNGMVAGQPATPEQGDPTLLAAGLCKGLMGGVRTVSCWTPSGPAWSDDQRTRLASGS
jgi:hypothetical protein